LDKVTRTARAVCVLLAAIGRRLSMKKSSSLSVILILSLLTPVFAQTTPAPVPAPSPATPPQQPQSATGDDDEVVRITSNLVQVDVVVTDSKGKQVTDLSAEDFELLEDKRPQLQAQLRIFRDGVPVFTGAPRPLDTTNQTDLKRLISGGALRLATDMTPGEYVLQVIVTDLFAKDKNSIATQWIDFDIVK
jgi:hypothetical protein